MKRTVAVKLAGQTLHLRTEDEEGYVQAIADHLQSRIDEIQRGAETASTHQIALLAGLRVVDELFRLQRKSKLLQEQTSRRVGRVLSLLDEHELIEAG